MSPFCYNESQAQIFFPLTKDEILRKGYKWKEPDGKRVQLQTFEISENIDRVSDDILNEVLVCEDCGCNYKIIARELEFYRDMGIFIPRKCYQCRHKERVSKRTKWELFDRKCSNCGKNIKTAYPLDLKEMIYCEKCYLEEVY
ncbi:hypothetical protein GF366_00940 [Candidatus Peregrinibacteria bacterium]|nr:hypothetical protein [Candidatus Peregrinibacteria bacterium]